MFHSQSAMITCFSFDMLSHYSNTSMLNKRWYHLHLWSYIFKSLYAKGLGQRNMIKSLRTTKSQRWKSLCAHRSVNVHNEPEGPVTSTLYQPLRSGSKAGRVELRVSKTPAMRGVLSLATLHCYFRSIRIFRGVPHPTFAMGAQYRNVLSGPSSSSLRLLFFQKYHDYRGASSRSATGGPLIQVMLSTLIVGI